MRRRLAREGRLTVEVKVIPRAAVNQVMEPMADGVLKVKVAAVPEKGRANAAVCALLAEYAGVPERNVQVVMGLTSQRKRVEIVTRG